jgi:hypothetical protein
MVINSTNNNNTNNHLSSKPNLLNTKRSRHMTLEIQTLEWDKHKYVTGLNRLMGSQSSCHHSRISNDNTYITYGCTIIYLVCSQLVKTLYFAARFPPDTMFTPYNLMQLSIQKWLIQKTAWVENAKC